MLLMNAESSGFTFIGYMIYKLLMAMIKMITGSTTPKMIPTVLEDPSEQKMRMFLILSIIIIMITLIITMTAIHILIPSH